MRRTVSATEARVHFGELLRQVSDERATVTIERGGKPRAVLISIDEYQRIVDANPQQAWEHLLEQARALIRADLAGRQLPPADETIQSMREERDERLLGLR